MGQESQAPEVQPEHPKYKSETTKHFVKDHVVGKKVVALRMVEGKRQFEGTQIFRFFMEGGMVMSLAVVGIDFVDLKAMETMEEAEKWKQ